MMIGGQTWDERHRLRKVLAQWNPYEERECLARAREAFRALEVAVAEAQSQPDEAPLDCSREERKP